MRRSVGLLRRGGGAASLAAVAYSTTPPAVTDAAEPTRQWLWTCDGVQLQRDADGATVYLDEATGEVQRTRPASVPSEAYEHRWRKLQPWDTEPQKDANGKRGHGARHLLLIRHAQYDLKGFQDSGRVLTPLGHEQTEHLASRLRAMHDAAEGNYKALKLDTLVCSELMRAIQTADAIALSLVEPRRSRNADLNEGRPCLPEPVPSHAAHYNNAMGDSERIERAYRQLCARPPPSQVGDTTEVVVCHANVIRYVVCRALQLPPEAWLRFSLPHASITHLVIRANGNASIRTLGDAGHLPADMVTR